MDYLPGMTTENSGTPCTSEQELRDAMVQRLIELGAARSPRVVAAFRSLPRHLAAPEVDLAKTYEPEFAAITKTDENGVDISSVSAPRVQAMQIEQADIQPGMRVLEIGSGGVNAAYLAEIVGDQGHVVTVDIDRDVTQRAADFVKATGYDRNITVLTADGEHGAPDHAPYDRIIVTVQAADIPPAWIHQLNDGGRLVVPLRMRGMTRTVAFVRDANAWSATVSNCAASCRCRAPVRTASAWYSSMTPKARRSVCVWTTIRNPTPRACARLCTLHGRRHGPG